MGGLDMTATAILARAEAAGMTLHADAGRLRMTAPALPPLALLHDLAGAKADLLDLLERRADEAAEREAIQAESALPPSGSPGRARLDRGQAAMLAGLMTAAEPEWTHWTPKKRRADHG